MRFTITLSSNAETGEGHVPDDDIEKISHLIFDNPFMAADLLAEWIFDLEMLYDEAVTEMQRDFENKRNKQ
jgi:hypothetical protein